MWIRLWSTSVLEMVQIMNPAHCLIRWLAALALLVVSGCESNHYEIEITPSGETFQRKLTFWRERTADEETQLVDFPSNELEKIVGAYDATVPSGSAQKHRLVSVFSDEMPDDDTIQFAVSVRRGGLEELNQRLSSPNRRI